MVHWLWLIPAAMVGGTVTLFVHCACILAGRYDQADENNNKEN